MGSVVIATPRPLYSLLKKWPVGWRDCPHPSRPALGPYQSPIHWLPGLSLGGKAVGAWHWPPTPSSVEVDERVELYLYSPSEPSWPVLGWTVPLPCTHCITGWVDSRVGQGTVPPPGFDSRTVQSVANRYIDYRLWCKNFWTIILLLLGESCLLPEWQGVKIGSYCILYGLEYFCVA